MVWGATAVAHCAEAWRKVMSFNVDACFFVAREVVQRSMNAALIEWGLSGEYTAPTSGDDPLGFGDPLRSILHSMSSAHSLWTSQC